MARLVRLGVALLVAAAFLAVTVAARAASDPAVTLRLVSARDHIEGSFTTAQAIWGDEHRIYLASQQGKLFVLARDRAAGFPLLQVVQDTAVALTAVRGDRERVYVLSRDDNLRVYRKRTRLVLERTVFLGYPAGSSLGESLAIVDRRHFYVGGGQLEADRRHVFVNRLNPGEVGRELAGATFAPGLLYAGVFDPDATDVYDRGTGEQVASIPNPPVVFPRVDQPRIFVDREILALTSEGRGVTLYDPRDLALEHFLPIPFANGVVRRSRWLIEGNESGEVAAFDLRALPDLTGSAVNLPVETGHTRSEDIEIRALWTDQHDGLIFAGSSWGNDLTRGPNLPSFFVLELARIGR